MIEASRIICIHSGVFPTVAKLLVKKIIAVTKPMPFITGKDIRSRSSG